MSFKEISMTHIWDGVKLYDALTRPDFAQSFEPNKTAFNIAWNTDLDYYTFKARSLDAQEQERITLAMKGMGSVTAKTISMSYPWRSLGNGGTIVDVGGGTGHVLMPVIKDFPGLNIVVQDLEYSISVGQKVC